MSTILNKEKLINDLEQEIWTLKKSLRMLDREFQEKVDEKPDFVG